MAPAADGAGAVGVTAVGVTAVGVTAVGVADVLRALRAAPGAPEGGWRLETTGAPSLERMALEMEPPRLEAALPIEGEALSYRVLDAEPLVGFHAFLDGIQSTRVLQYLPGGMPLIFGTVAAVVRERRDRELHTWNGAPELSTRVYVPTALTPAEHLRTFDAAGIPVHDTLDGADASDGQHPQLLLTLARTAVQRERERLETSLAERWCATRDQSVYVDGGISGAGLAARSPHAVGVVKSHRTLYASGDGVGVITRLRAGQRTTAFEIRSARRTAVASWYLRLRDGGDPMFALVRIEVARDTFTAERADEVSRWVLAERTPLALPDQRWHTMAYGIADCERYLRAIAP